MSGLYIHIPFCGSRCAYCDFYSTTPPELIAEYLEAVKREMTSRQTFLPRSLLITNHSSLNTIYVGGGTPSQLAPGQLQGLLDHAATLWDCTGLREVTLEANPEDLTLEYLEQLRITNYELRAKRDNQRPSSGSAAERRAGKSEGDNYELRAQRNNHRRRPAGQPEAGADKADGGNYELKFNRLSIGIQSFDDGLLRLMNRRHSAEKARRAVRAAQRAGFDNISIDLIYGIPGMTPAQWEHTLDEATALGVQHISAYHLTIEPGTAFANNYELRITNYDEAERESERQFTMLRRKLADAGFEQYEISNFALPGRRAVHNSAYWGGGAYLGVGPSAHSFDGSRRREWVVADIGRYIAGVGTDGIYDGETLSDSELFNERVMTSLRRVEGIDLGELERGCSRHCEGPGPKQSSFRTWIASPSGLAMTSRRRKIERFLRDGLLVQNGDRIAIPAEKFLLSDYIISGLFE